MSAIETILDKFCVCVLMLIVKFFVIFLLFIIYHVIGE